MSDQILREAVRELADEARPVPGFANAARRQGRHIRARRRAGVVMGVVAVAAAIVFVAVPRSSGGHQLPITGPQSPTPSAGPPPPPATLTENGGVALPGGWRVLGVGDWVLDGDRYREVHPPPHAQVLPSPDGKLVAVITTTGRDAVIDIQRPDGTHVRTIHPGHVSGFSWSPWSDRLLAQYLDYQMPDHFPGYAVIDVATGSVTLGAVDADCSVCPFVWTLDGRGVALALHDRPGGGDGPVSSVNVFFVQNGVLSQHYTITGMPQDPYAWSPDGIHAIGLVDPARPTYALFDLRDGTSTPFPCDGRFVDPNTVLCGQNGEVDLYRLDRASIARTVAVLRGAFAAKGLQAHVVLGPAR